MLSTNLNMRFIIPLLLGIHAACGALHSLKYFYTGSSGMSDFPEFVTVGLVDEQPISYYDSNIRTATPRQDWMAKTEGPEYWKNETQISIRAEQSFKVDLGILRQRFNHTGGVHTFQKMYGCEWDEETGLTEGYEQYGYDGDDFIRLDLERMQYIAPVQKAFITKQKWDHDRSQLEHNKYYLTQICIEWLKKYLSYGKNTLKRTVHPSVSLLQKSPSSPVTCQATGFYPRGVMVFWRRDGEEVFEDVEHGEVLPNQDGTFQKSVHLNLTMTPEDLDSGRCDCVVQLSGVKEDFVTKLERSVLKTNHVPDGSSVLTALIIGGLVALLLVVCIISAVVIWKKKTAKKGFVPAKTSGDGSTSTNDPLISEKGPPPVFHQSKERKGD